MPRREARAKGEPHNWSKAVGSRNPHEIEARNRRFKTAREHWCAVYGLNFRPNVRAQEFQPIYRHLVAGSCDDVVGAQFPFPTIRNLPEAKTYPASLNGSALHRVSQMQRQSSDDLILHEPSPGRTQSRSNSVQT